MTEFTTEGAAHYLAGIIDGEGHVSVGTDGKGWLRRIASVANTDPDIIAAVVEAARVLGIPHTLTEQSRRTSTGKAVWVVAFSRIEAWDALAELPIRSHKLDVLRDGCQAARRTKRPPRDELEAKYATRGSEDIGRDYGVKGTTVIQWLRHYKIPVRARGGAHLNAERA